MPAVLGWLIQIAGTLVGKVLLSLGITFLSYKGLDTVLGSARDHFYSAAGGLGSTTIGVMALMKIDVCVNMLFSALLGRLTLSGLTSGGLKKLVFK